MEERKNVIEAVRKNSKRKISVLAEINRDVENCFFVIMLYKDNHSQFQTVYGIKDELLISDIVELSYNALNGKNIREVCEKEIIVYDLKTQRCFSGIPENYKAKNRIIVGTNSRVEFSEINYMLERIDETLKEKSNGEISVKYKDKVMTVEEFKQFQSNLRVYNTV